MPVDIIKEFLGVEPVLEGVTDPEQHKFFRYESERLRYEIHLNLEGNNLHISADFEYPFGFKSLYEIAVEYDRINIETESEFYDNQKVLVCRKDFPDVNNFKTLMIMKWGNAELSVWPNYIKPTK